MENQKYGVEHKYWYTSEDIHAAYTHGFWTAAGFTTVFWAVITVTSLYILGSYG